MKYKGVYQRNANDCGVASLLSIIKYYKGNNTFENIRYLTKCDNNGITALNLINASKKLGFDSRGLKCNYEDLFNLKKPLICHLILKNGYNHYVVLHKINGKEVMIFDPYSGIKKYTKFEFLDVWSKVVIELKPQRKLDYIKEDNYNYFKQIIFNNKKIYVEIILFSIISILLTLITNYYFKALMDFNNLCTIFIIFTIIILIREINDLYRNSKLVKLENKVLNELNINTHKKLLSLPYYYFNSRTKGDIITKFDDLEHIKNLLVKFPICVFIDTILLIFTIIILFNVNSKLFIIFSITCIFYLVVLIIFNNKIKCLVQNNQECNSIKNTILLENINSINTIKNMSIKDLRHNIFNKVYDLFISSNINYENVYIRLNFIKNIFLFIGINLTIYVGMHMVNSKILALSDLILFNSLTLYFIEPLKEICELSPVVKNGINAIKRVSEIYSIGEVNKYNLIPDNLDITFNNLNFSYNGYDNILNNINYKINYKDKVMVIGKSGSGKSTMFKLLSKVYEIEDDMIKIGNSDINSIDTSNIITYVSEEEKIFNDTIYNNIVLDKNNNDIDKIIEITNVKNILNDKNLDLNSIVREDGSNLSKGEKQKIILSRVLLKNSKIIILDESLSGVEEEEEFQIMSKILKEYKDSTIIYISHSRVCLNLFDKVLNFNKEVL